MFIFRTGVGQNDQYLLHL